MRITHAFTLAVSLLFISTLPAWAWQSGGGNAQRGHRSAPQRQTPPATNQQRDRDTVYGSQLMTPAERNAYREQMRSLKTNQERETFRMQHHAQMQQRATERGVRLPDMPPQAGNQDD